MATTTARQRTTHPMSYYIDMVKDMDDSQKLELMTILIDSMKQIRPISTEQMLEGYPFKRYTKAELNAMLDEAEAEIAAGKGIDDDDLLKEDEEEFERELKEERMLQQEIA